MGTDKPYRRRWIVDRTTGKLVPEEEYVSRETSRLTVMTDTIDDFKSMADGKHYSSKSRYRQELRARGLVEIGNDRVEQQRFEPTGVARDLAEAWDSST